jgi:AraC-like DNA-binding protein
MTDREHEFSEVLDDTALDCRVTHSIAGTPVSPETRPHGATPNNLSLVAARLVEAACRARDGDRDAARAHIAQAVALLHHMPSSVPTDLRAMGERRITDGGELVWEARRPIPRIDANLVRRNNGARAPTGSCEHQLDDIRLRRVLDYISTNMDDDITLADLAGVAGYSPFHFARKFTLALGVSPRRYLSRMRLERAMAELAAGKLPLTEIALNAHFSSQASFTTAFHRAIGMTPKEYQRHGPHRSEPVELARRVRARR